MMEYFITKNIVMYINVFVWFTNVWDGVDAHIQSTYPSDVIKVFKHYV